MVYWISYHDCSFRIGLAIAGWPREKLVSIAKVSAGVSGQWGFPDTWSSTSRFSMKRKPI